MIRAARAGPASGPASTDNARADQEIGTSVPNDLVDRRFTAEAADALWLKDITENRTDEGKRYVCAIEDGWSIRIVEYSINSSMSASRAVSVLNNAVA